MSWTMREAAEVVLAGRKAARRSGREYKIDRQKMTYAGFSAAEIEQIERTVERIENTVESELASLRRR